METILKLSPILYVDVNLVSDPLTTELPSGILTNPGAETFPLIGKYLKIISTRTRWNTSNYISSTNGIDICRCN